MNVGKQNDILVNGKPSTKHCQFCNEEHRYPSYDRRGELKYNATEYMLSTNAPNVENDIHTRLKLAMPVTMDGGKGTVLSKIAKDFQNSNFIIHGASLVIGMPFPNALNHMCSFAVL